MTAEWIDRCLSIASALWRGRLRIVFDGIPLEFEGIPLRKAINWILLETSLRFHSARPWGLPTHLQIEPSSICNLRCPACRVASGLGRRGGLMDLALFKKIIDETHESVFLISLWGWGEPFLNPHIFEMIAYAKSRGIQLICSTNGHFLKRPGQAERLVDSGLDVLIVAVDGAVQDTYALYRRPGRLKDVLEGIRRLADHKRDRKSPTPRINVRMVVMRQNEGEIPAMIELARSCGADILSLKTMNPLSENPYSLDRTPHCDHGNPFIPKDPRHRRFAYTGDRMTRIRLKKNPCKRLWNNPKILDDGTVCTCTCDVAGKLRMGDLRRQALKHIWEAKPYRSVRLAFRRDWESMLPCCTCTYAYRGGSCINEIISDVVFFDGGRGHHVKIAVERRPDS